MDRKRHSPSSSDCEQFPVAKKTCTQHCTGSDKHVVMKKRHDYLQWDEYFMAVAFLSSERSKDPKSQVWKYEGEKENTLYAQGSRNRYSYNGTYSYMASFK